MRRSRDGYAGRSREHDAKDIAPFLGCPVRYVQASERFICPCHGGVYQFDGKVAGGPPVRPLDRFETRVVKGRVQVGPRFSLDSHLHRFKVRDPSNHVDGLWQYIYPSRPTT